MEKTYREALEKICSELRVGVRTKEHLTTIYNIATEALQFKDERQKEDNEMIQRIARSVYEVMKLDGTAKSLSPESGEQDEEESYQVVLWEEAAMKLFKKYNPGMTLSEGIGNRIYLGFSKDMDFLREYYKITRTT